MAAQASNYTATSPTQDRSPQELVERLFARIGEVSTLPAVALQIVSIDQGSAADDLHDAVRYDAALAMRIMRTVNSSYYSLQNKVADLKLAITLLGFKEIRNLALTAYVAQLFKKGEGYGPYSREGLWNHLIGTGIVAKLIAEKCGRVPPREAYLAGLLHDLGLILIDQYLNRPFCQVLDRLTDETSLAAAEREMLGFDHMELGQYVATRWNLPEHLTTAIRHHHDPEAYDGPHREMVCVVTLANLLCHAKGFSSTGIRDAAVPPTAVFTTLGLGKRQLAEIWEQLDGALEAADVMALAQAS